LPELRPADDDHAKPTAAGCVLTLLTVAVIFTSAVPIVQWRDAETGQPLPRTVAIVAPLLLGAAFHGAGSLLLWLVGLRLWSKPEKEDSGPSDGSSRQGEGADERDGV
jgi:hypothetical protein